MNVPTSELLSALAGGALIGLASALLLLFSGRIVGISGVLGGLLQPTRSDIDWRVAFLGGLLLGGLALRALLPAAFTPASASAPVLVAAGLLVGFGTRLGNGCTSGHGVCGVGRLSRRSIAATLTFLITGMVTVFFTQHVLGGAP